MKPAQTPLRNVAPAGFNVGWATQTPRSRCSPPRRHHISGTLPSQRHGSVTFSAKYTRLVVHAPKHTGSRGVTGRWTRVAPLVARRVLVRRRDIARIITSTMSVSEFASRDKLTEQAPSAHCEHVENRDQAAARSSIFPSLSCRKTTIRRAHLFNPIFTIFAQSEPQTTPCPIPSPRRCAPPA